MRAGLAGYVRAEVGRGLDLSRMDRGQDLSPPADWRVRRAQIELIGRSGRSGRKADMAVVARADLRVGRWGRLKDGTWMYGSVYVAVIYGRTWALSASSAAPTRGAARGEGAFPFL